MLRSALSKPQLKSSQANPNLQFSPFTPLGFIRSAQEIESSIYQNRFRRYKQHSVYALHCPTERATDCLDWNAK